MEKVVPIFEKCGQYCINKEDARELYILIKSALLIQKSVTKIVLDFSQVRLVSSEFCYEFIGRLLKDFNAKELKDIVSIINASKATENSINFTIEHYDKYFRDPKYKEVIDKAFSSKDKGGRPPDLPTEEEMQNAKKNSKRPKAKRFPLQNV